jgi:hypothetical protein
MADASAFTKLVPGFDFLQGLVKNAGAALPSMGQWIAPTLNPEELEKRIEELRTVQFWLEQNARMLGTTIQALEVQRMTLSTLRTMNVQMNDLRDALKVPTLVPVAAAADADDEDDEEEKAAEAARPLAPAPTPIPAAAASKARRKPAARAAAAPADPAAGMVDPMQWWGALTRQFTDLATNAMKDTAADAAKHLAGSLVKQGVETAGETLRKAAAMPVAAAQKAAEVAGSAASAAVSATRAVTAGAPAKRAKAATASKASRKAAGTGRAKPAKAR